MKKIIFIFLIFTTNIIKAQTPTFGNPGPVTICINGSYYLNPSSTIGTFSSVNSSVATVDPRGYVTGITTGTTDISLTTGGGTVTATINVGSTSSITITDNTALPNYKFISNTPQGPQDGTNNYVGYNGFTYSSQTRPSNSGYYRASKQVGNEAGCPVPFYIIKCDACATVLPVLTIGEAYGGGIVFYVTDGGTHGLIAATVDQSTGIRWFNGTYKGTGATGTAIGTGLANTNSIISSQGETTTSYAAGLARAYAGGVYTDWYLPSKEELNLMYINIGKGASSPNYNIGGFASNYYWSSTENDRTNAWSQHFSTGNQNSTTKNYTLYVRAIRAF